ncbi:putative adenine phosphoribosyltransferase [Dioscorea sansibarensis]
MLMLEFITLLFFFLGIEAEGFIFGSSITLATGAKFVPPRKPRKLPGGEPSSKGKALEGA